MQFEEFDNKVKEAADHHHPAYNGDAWNKMEKLLDKHLPQKKDDRRRIIFFLLLFFLLGGGTYLFVSRPGHSKSSLSATEKIQHDISVPESATNSQPAKEQSNVTSSITNSGEHNTETVLNDKNKTADIKFNHKQYVDAIQNTMNNRVKKIKGFVPVTGINNDLSRNETKTPANIQDNSVTTETVLTKTDPKTNNEQLPDNPLVKKTNPVDNISSDIKKQEKTTIDKKDNEVANKNNNTVISPISSTKTNQQKGKKANSLFLSLSAGPDLSTVGVSSLGKTKITYGAGIGYNFHDKFSIRTGFYSARKIYTASPNEYHPPASFWTYYPDLKKVDADCRVFEIPLLFSYNFKNSRNYSINGTVGISSYLMKRETYNYLYKNSGGQLLNRKFTLNNKNHNYFSVLTLAGGYQRNINNTFFFMAEPYVKIPFDGIGFGKMQLNSAGVLFSLGIKPFQSAKKNR